MIEGWDPVTGKPLVMQLNKSWYKLLQPTRKWHGTVETKLLAMTITRIHAWSRLLRSEVVPLICSNSSATNLNIPTNEQWRVEERDDWRALLDSMQEDRTELQQKNARLEVRTCKKISQCA